MIDLSEIPTAKGGEPDEDLFELFAREFLESVGFKCIAGPDRGADDGRDLIVEESLIGPASTEVRRWLVSAKHYASSRRAVSPSDEMDPAGRCRRHNAKGFIAFYSTVPSSSLARCFESLSRQGLHVLVLDAGRISQALHQDPQLRSVFQRFLPESYERAYARKIDGRVRFLNGLGWAYFNQDAFDTYGPEIVVDSDSGIASFTNHKVEMGVLAVYIYEKLRAGRFKILSPYISFDPSVWKYLCALLALENDPVPGIGRTILASKEPFYNRMLVCIAGEARQSDAIEPICKTVLHDGFRLNQYITESRALVTSYFSVAKRALRQIARGPHEIIEKYQAKAKELKRWQHYSLFKQAMKRVNKIGEEDEIFPHSPSKPRRLS